MRFSKIRLTGDDITVKEAAEILGVKTQRVYVFIREARVKPIGTFYGRYVLSRAQVKRFGRVKRKPGRKKRR